jgi:uncharacterized protein (DUF983 family)
MYELSDSRALYNGAKPVKKLGRGPRIDAPSLASLLRAAARLRCPVCLRGKIFGSLLRMEARCPFCGTRLEREEGYFLGSIYLGYGLTLAVGLVLYSVGAFWLGLPDTILLPAFALFALLLPLVTWRYTRSFWLAIDQYLDPRRPGG